VADLRRISDLCLQLGHAVAALVESVDRDLALRAEASLMANEVKPIVIEAPESELLTRKQVAAILRLHERTVRTRVRSGELPEPIKVGKRSIRWRRETIEAWIAEAEAKTT
jgi:excisionase family DNA binding protein